MSDSGRLSPAAALDVLSVYLDIDQEPELRESALNDDRVPDEIVNAWLRTLPDELRRTALSRCSRPAVLAHWAASEDIEDRMVVAFHALTPAEVLERLVEDPAEYVRCQLPFAPNASGDVLQKLFDDPSPAVQEAVETAFGTEIGLWLRAGERLAEIDGDDEDD